MAPLSPPTLSRPSDFRANSELRQNVIDLVNAAFHRSKATDPQRWSNETLRFPDEEMFFGMLGSEGAMALVFDEVVAANGAQVEGVRMEGERKVVACAALVPWKGGWHAEGAGKEEGWEMKIVCVHSGEGYLKRGLATQVTRKLEQWIIEKEKTRMRSIGNSEGGVKNEGNGKGNGKVKLWILAAECLNGDYWRRKGYVEVRRKTEGAGTWSCKTSFEMVVFRKEIEFDLEG